MYHTPHVERVTRLQLIVLFVVLCFSAEGVCAASESYTLHRKVDGDADWRTIGTFTVSRHSPDSPAKLRYQPPRDEMELSAEEKKAMATAKFVYYRAVRHGDDTSAGAVSIALSPCSLVRGFEAVGHRTMLLHETLVAAIGHNVTIIGLQAVSNTNMFHARMVDGDECDLSVLFLFPEVKMRVRVGLLAPSSPLTVPNYTELDIYMGRVAKEKRAKKGGKKAGDRKEATGAESPLTAKEELQEEEEDERTFLQKYWVYIVVPFVISVIQSLVAARE
uniref:ER membrane protein complex subunit 10 n=1 Tax=Trypanosoma congolense (strain IL3000) TaxID=1068625 RepID=G0UIS7_TRYCI|nr:conserved hypothetical protein [Trypanosoma congolense IL3000]